MVTKYNVKYLVIGAYAIGNYDYSRHTLVSDDFFDEQELLKRSNELTKNRVKPLSREEVFDGIC